MRISRVSSLLSAALLKAEPMPTGILRNLDDSLEDFSQSGVGGGVKLNSGEIM